MASDAADLGRDRNRGQFVRRKPDYARASADAKLLLKKYGCNNPPFDPEKIADGEGLSVIYAEFEYPDSRLVSGFFNLEENTIVVNKEIDEKRITFTIAHELAHFRLHKDYIRSNGYRPMPRFNDYTSEKPPEEVEADTFAANLLVPLHILKRFASFAGTMELARLFFVSEDTIRNRLDLLRRHPSLALG